MGFNPSLGSRAGRRAFSTISSVFSLAKAKLHLASIADSSIIGNIAGATAEPTGVNLSVFLDHALGSTEGQILQRGSSAWQVLAAGSNHQSLTSGGAAALNAWSFPAPAQQSFVAGNASSASTSAVMAGFGSTCAFTPSRSGIVLAFFQTSTSANAIGGQTLLQGQFGTGTAPVAGAAITGTQFTAADAPAFTGVADIYCISMLGTINLTPGTAYWFDITFKTVSGGGNVTANNTQFNIIEF